MKKNFRLLSMIIVFCTMLFNTGAAAYVIGDITIVGGANLNGPLGSATQISSFSAPPTVISVDGDLALFANSGDPVLFTVPFKFGISTAYPTLYSVGGWNFELFDSTIDNQNANFLSISGTGEFTGNGYQPTPAIFRFSSQSPSAGGTYSFSASAHASSVPESANTFLIAILPISVLVLMRRISR